jgi:hypothetical protein
MHFYIKRIHRATHAEALAPVFDVLNAYAATMHFKAQSTIELAGDRATGESYSVVTRMPCRKVWGRHHRSSAAGVHMDASVEHEGVAGDEVRVGAG